MLMKSTPDDFLHRHLLFQHTTCRNKSACCLTKVKILLLKMKCQETHIYMKAECLQTKCNAASFWGQKGLKGKEKRVSVN